MSASQLVEDCIQAMRSGCDFPTLWSTVIKPNPVVAGIPVQRESEGHPYIEIPLLRGDWLVVDYDRKYVQLR